MRAAGEEESGGRLMVDSTLQLFEQGGRITGRYHNTAISIYSELLLEPPSCHKRILHNLDDGAENKHIRSRNS